jgi:hypothetical protein
MAGSGAPGAQGAWPGERSWVKLRFFCWQIGGLRFLYHKWLILLSCFLLVSKENHHKNGVISDLGSFEIPSKCLVADFQVGQDLILSKLIF